ncbi:MAG: hypothetical protein E3J35_05370 [Methanomassiliicoccales archaeon]|nr:MAG: hypothetical protein E3J35_05370 [Methanomassiliicoccales archaeon]
MKDIPRDLLQSKGLFGLVGVTVAFVVSLLPFGTFVVGPELLVEGPSAYVWTHTEVSMSVLLFIGITISIVADVLYIWMCARRGCRIREKRFAVPYVVGFDLYSVAIGYMVLGAGNLPPLHALVYASAAIFYTNRLFLLYPASSKDNLSYRDWTIFASVFLGEMLVFGVLLWLLYFGSV